MTCKTSGCIDKDVLSSCHERGTKEKNSESPMRNQTSGLRIPGKRQGEKIDTFFHASLFPRARLALASRSPEELTEMTPVLHISWRMFTSPGCDVSSSQVTS